MRVALTGVGHWHTPLYLSPLLDMEGVEVVCVSDPDPLIAKTLAERAGCNWEASVEALLDGHAPDLVFVLGSHGTMATSVRAVTERKIPLVVEKPAGLNESQVAELAAAAELAGSFAAVPLVFRTSGFMELVEEIAARERILYADFKFVAGLPSRYREAGCHWMFDKAEAGGGVLTNLGVHFLDLFDLLGAGNASIVGSRLANIHGEGDVEDYAAVSLHAGTVLGRVETAYLYPAPGGVFDMHFSVRTENHYLAANGPDQVELSDLSGKRRMIQTTTTNMPIYPQFVVDVVDRVRNGRKPIAGLRDMTRVMHLVDQSYTIAGHGAVCA